MGSSQGKTCGILKHIFVLCKHLYRRKKKEGFGPLFFNGQLSPVSKEKQMCEYDDCWDCDVCNPPSPAARDRAAKARTWAKIVEEDDLFYTATMFDLWSALDAERASSALVREQQITSFLAGN
jgi:hypothetical protein